MPIEVSIMYPTQVFERLFPIDAGATLNATLQTPLCTLPSIKRLLRERSFAKHNNKNICFKNV